MTATTPKKTMDLSKEQAIKENKKMRKEFWYEVFGLGSRGPSIDIDRMKMLRFKDGSRNHAFLKF